MVNLLRNFVNPPNLRGVGGGGITHNISEDQGPGRPIWMGRSRLIALLMDLEGEGVSLQHAIGGFVNNQRTNHAPEAIKTKRAQIRTG